MNFLAHDFLSFGVPGIVVGNYLGDFVRNSEVPSLPEDVQNGITIHRKIDSYTDQHPTVKTGTKLLHPSMGKYAPVVLDIYFDYLLTKRWSDFCKVSLSDYCLVSYSSLLEYAPLLTDKVALRIQKMTADRWLENYGTYQGLQRVFNFLSQRTTFDSNMKDAPSILEQLEPDLEEVFMDFFPDIRCHIEAELWSLK